MQKIMFNDKYVLTQAVLDGRKTQTRRIVTDAKMIELIKCFDTPAALLCIYDRFMLNPELREKFLCNRKVMHYRTGETVAIAQSYKDVLDYLTSTTKVEDLQLRDTLIRGEGYTNKMFVQANLMPHHIRITKIRIERLQDISDNDCLAEGIQLYPDVHKYMWGFSYVRREALRFELSTTPRDAYANLIDKISGKGTWASNPYVFVYEFELIK